MGESNGSGPLTWQQATENFVGKGEFEATVKALSTNVCDLNSSINQLKRAVYVASGVVAFIAFVLANWSGLRAFFA